MGLIRLQSSSLPSGSVLQVKHAVKTDAQTITVNVPTFEDVSGLSITITPSSASSKILVMYSVVMANGSDQSHGYIKVLRGSTDLNIADTASNRTRAASVVNTGQGGETHTVSNTFLDSPNTTNATTYKIQAGTNNTNSTNNFINRSSRDIDNAGYDGRMISTMCVLEIAG